MLLKVGEKEKESISFKNVQVTRCAIYFSHIKENLHVDLVVIAETLIPIYYGIWPFGCAPTQD
jgi:hypothetical protein